MDDRKKPSNRPKTDRMEPRRCGAKGKRSGLPCKRFGGPNGRCHLHGGKSKGGPRPPKGNQRSATHGFYSKALRKDELERFGAAEVGTIDEEIRIAKVKLHRALEAQKLWDAVEEGKTGAQLLDYLPVLAADQESGVTDTTRGRERFTKNKLFRRKNDFTEEIQKWCRLIGQLEIQRAELLDKGKSVTPVDDFVKDVREVMIAMGECNPGGEL